MAKLFEKIDDNPGEYFNMLLENYDDLNEDVGYIKWVQLPNKKWKIWGSSSSSKLDSDFLNRARKQNDINYLDAKISKNGEYPDGVSEEDIETINKFEKEESLKEDKFVPKDKMSKKAKKELNDKKRGTWGSTNPVTRVQPNKKAYDRKRDKKELDEYFDYTVLSNEVRKELKEGAIGLQYIVDDLFDIINDPDSTYVDITNTAYELKSITEYLYDVYNRYSR